MSFFVKSKWQTQQLLELKAYYIQN